MENTEQDRIVHLVMLGDRSNRITVLATLDRDKAVKVTDAHNVKYLDKKQECWRPAAIHSMPLEFQEDEKSKTPLLHVSSQGEPVNPYSEGCDTGETAAYDHLHLVVVYGVAEMLVTLATTDREKAERVMEARTANAPRGSDYVEGDVHSMPLEVLLDEESPRVLLRIVSDDNLSVASEKMMSHLTTRTGVLYEKRGHVAGFVVNGTCRIVPRGHNNREGDWKCPIHRKAKMKYT